MPDALAGILKPEIIDLMKAMAAIGTFGAFVIGYHERSLKRERERNDTLAAELREAQQGSEARCMAENARLEGEVTALRAQIADLRRAVRGRRST